MEWYIRSHVVEKVNVLLQFLSALKYILYQLSFRFFLQENFQNYIFFLSQYNTQNISQLCQYIVYIKTKFDNHVILEIKLSFYSKSSNGNDFIVLFEIGLSRLINKLSLRSNLNLLQSVAKMLKSSKFMAQLHCNRWSDIADCLTFLRCFPVRLEIPMCSAAPV